MLTGPIFMLQVYDRVLTSRSEATLVALVVITAFLFLMMGLLDHARARLLARAAARFQARMDARVMGAILTRSAPATGLQDLEAMQRFASGPGPFAFFDAPWTPVFLGVLFIFHWLLGILAVASGVLLLSLALLNSARTARLQAQAGVAGAKAGDFVEQLRAGAETVRGLGRRGDGARGRAAQRSAGGEHGGGVGPGRRLCGDVADAAPVPAVPDAEQVSALPGVDRGLFRIVAVEEVVRQAEMFQRRQLPFRRAGRRYQPSVGLAALGDDDLLAGPHACKQLAEVGAGLGDLVAGGRHGWFPTSLVGANRTHADPGNNVQHGWSFASANFGRVVCSPECARTRRGHLGGGGHREMGTEPHSGVRSGPLSGRMCGAAHVSRPGLSSLKVSASAALSKCSQD